jgi:hypothetical protein
MFIAKGLKLLEGAAAVFSRLFRAFVIEFDCVHRLAEAQSKVVHLEEALRYMRRHKFAAAAAAADRVMVIW